MSVINIVTLINSLWILPANAVSPSGVFSVNKTEQAFIAAADALIDHYWGASFPDCSNCFYFNSRSDQADKKNEWWWQAQAMDVVIDAYRLTGSSRYLQMYEPWFDGICRYNYEQWPDDPWRNNSIDDMEWIAITLIRMYETSGEARYLQQAQKLYDRYIITTWGPNDEDPWNGGISWSTDSLIPKTKNACSNGPGGIIASMLASHCKALEGHDKKGMKKKYLKDLKQIYDWEHDHLFNTTTGAVYDHIGKRGVAKRVWSYNTGTFLAMATALYQQTHNRQYLHDAVKAADYSILMLGDAKTGLMNNVSKSPKGGDVGLFHGIFFRYLTHLIKCKDLPEHKRNAYVDFLRANSICAVNCLQPGVNIFSKDWVGETITSTTDAPLTPHVTGCTLLSATLNVTKSR